MRGEARPDTRYCIVLRPLQNAVIPAGVHSVLAARIDRLSAEHKLVLQTAAVIGRTFADAVLARVMGQTVESLTEALSALCAAVTWRTLARIRAITGRAG